MLTLGSSLELNAVLELNPVLALNGPTHQPGDRIVVSEATSPVVGPIGGVTRVGALKVEIETGAKVSGGAAPRLDIWSGTATDTIGVRTGAGSSVFNAGTIQAGSTVLPSGPAPGPDGIRPLADYSAMFDQPALDLGQPPLDAAASREAALARAIAAEETVGGAATAARDQLTVLQQRSDAAAAARPEPWIDPREVDLTGPSDPDNSWGGSGGSMTLIDSNVVGMIGIGSTDRTIAVDATDDSLIVNAGRISSDGDGIVAGSNNRILNVGTLVTGRDGINAQDGNTVVNSGAIAASGDGVYARDGNTIANTGRIDAGDRGIATGNDSLVVNSGSISANDTGIAGGDRTAVTNAGTVRSDGAGIALGGDGAVLNTGTIDADRAAISTEGSGVIDNRGSLSSGGLNAISGGPGSVVINAGAVIGGIDLSQDGVVVNDGGVTGRIGADIAVNAGEIGGTYSDTGTVLNSGTSTGSLDGAQVLNIGAVTSSEGGLNGAALVNEGRVDAGYWGIQIDGGGLARNTGNVSGGASGVLAFDSVGVGFVNSGRVTAGNASGGRAIDLSGSSGDNSVALLSGSELGGTVVGGTGQDTLILDGSGAEDADISGIERVAMIGDDWSLTGDIEAEEVLAAKGSLTLGGTVTGDAYVYDDATLTGDGAIIGQLVVAGTIAPGNGIGDLIVDGDAVVNPGGRLVIEVGGSAPGLFDTFTTTDDLFFDGILEFVFDAGANLDLDDMLFGVLGYDGLLVGPDSQIAWSGLPFGWYLAPTLGADALDIGFGYSYRLTVSVSRFDELAIPLRQVPAPASPLLIGFGLFGLQLVRRASHANSHAK